MSAKEGMSVNEGLNVNEQQETATNEASEPVATEQTQTQEREQEQSVKEQRLHAQIEDLQQKLLRLQADFDNARRRARQEKEDAAKYAALPVLLKVLPALDNLERAMTASRQSEDFAVLAKGVEMTAKLLLEGLQQEGLQAMDCVGQPFNPELHQAIMTVEDDAFGDGQIVEEMQRGYLLKDKVIRPAMVKVNKG